MIEPALFKGHFQVCYVAQDAKKARATLGRHYGVTRWHEMDQMEITGPESPARWIGCAWIGDFMLEVIEPNEAIDSIYRDWQSNSPNALRLHHLGFLVDNAAEMAATKQRLAEAGFPTVSDGRFGDVLDFAYVDTTGELGHYYEIISLKEQGKALFASFPQN